VSELAGERILIALGGNAMTAPDGSATPQAQERAVTAAMEHVADLVAAGAEVALTHGNGPQVGNLLIKNQQAAHVVPPVPLDWCVAQTQATIGVLVMNALEAALAARELPGKVAVVVSRTLVDPADPGFGDPRKPIGRYFPEAEARRFTELGQSWKGFGERGWRRVVASPEPLEILEAPTVEALIGSGQIVVAAGGGGVPVVRTEDGALQGVEAVVDKDLAGRLLARQIGATTFVIATDVEHVMIGYGTSKARALTRVTPAELADHAAAGEFGDGSMGPKVAAARRFVTDGGKRAVITSLDHIAEAVRGNAGTIVEE
jgi:carbamate kinase